MNLNHRFTLAGVPDVLRPLCGVLGPWDERGRYPGPSLEVLGAKEGPGTASSAPRTSTITPGPLLCDDYQNRLVGPLAGSSAGSSVLWPGPLAGSFGRNRYWS